MTKDAGLWPKTVPKKIFSFSKNQAGVLDISMYGTLYGDWFNGSDEAALRDAIKACAPDDHIRLSINSDGGDMFAGIAIHGLLKSHPGDVTCVIDGLAASAASIVAMGGKTVMKRGAMMMIHNPWAVVKGDADAMRAAAEFLDKSTDGLVSIYKNKTGKNTAELKKLLAAETWMTAEQAVDAGFANELEGDEDDMEVDLLVNSNRILVNNVSFDGEQLPPRIQAMAQYRSVVSNKEEKTMKTVLAALSLKDNANEAEALSVVNRIAGERAQFLAVTGKESVAEALGILAAWKTASDEVSTLKAAAQKSAEEQAAKDFDSEIESARKSGLLAPSNEHKRNKQALSFKGKTDALASLRGFLGALDPLVNVQNGKPTASAEPQPTAGAAIVLTDEEKRIAAKMNIPHDKLLANKQRLSLKALQAPTKRESAEDDAEDAA